MFNLTVLDGIATYLSYFKWDYLFILIALFGIFGAIWSLIRGLYHSTCRYIGIGILTLFLVFMIQPLVNYVASIDLSRFFPNGINISNNQIAVTTIDQTIVKIVESLGLVSSATDVSVDQLALELSHAVLGFALFFVGFLLIILLLGWILGELIYSVSFAIFLSKDKRKNHVHRGFASLEGAICGLIIGALFISPLTSVAGILAGTASSVKTEENNGQISKEDLASYQAYIDLLASYQTSAYYSTMTLGSSDPTKALDTKLMSEVTEVSIGGTTTSLANELNTLLTLAPNLLTSISLVNGKISVDYASLLTKDNVSKILDKLGTFKLLIGLLPAGLQIASNQARFDKFGLNFDFTQLDLTGTMDDLNKIYGALYDAGIIDQYAIPMLSDGTTPSAFTLDFTKKEYFKTALKTLADNKVVKKFIPKMLALAAKNLGEQGNIDYLSTLESRYETIDFGTDLSNIVEFAFDAFRLLGYTSISQETLNNLGKDLVDKLTDSTIIKGVKSLLCGTDLTTTGALVLPATKDDQGNEIYPAYTLTDFPGLLGMDFLSSDANKQILNIKKLLKSTIGNIDGVNEYITADTIDKLGDKLTSLNTGSTASFRKEFSYLLDVVPDAKKLIDNNADITKEENRTLITSMLTKIENSTLLADILPDFISKALSGQNVSDMLYGLSVSDFNFSPTTDYQGNPTTLIKEVKNLIEVAGQAYDIYEAISTATDAASVIQALDSTMQNKIATVLNGIINNQVINPVKRVNGTETTLVKNVNFNKLIAGLFSSGSLADTGLTIANDLSGIDWTGTNGEINNLVSIIGLMHDNPALFTKGNQLTLDDLTPDLIESIFSKIGNSPLLSASLSGILNKTVAPLITDLGVNVDFNSITDWEAEGKAFANVVTRLKELGSSDLASIDWTNLDYREINALLTSLAQTSLLSVQKNEYGLYVDKFGELAYTMIGKSGLKNGSTDFIGDSLNKESFSVVKDQYTGEVYTAADGESYFAWSGTKVLTNFDITVGGETKHISALLDTDGEVYKISMIFKAIQDVGLANVTNSTAAGYDPTAQGDLYRLLTSMMDSKLFSAALPYALNYAISQISDVEVSSDNVISFKAANPLAINTLSKTEKDAEIETMCRLYDWMKNNILLTKLAGDPSKLAQEDLTSLENFLDDLASLKIMTTVKPGYDYSVFDSVIAAVVHSSTLDQMITGASQAQAKALVLPLISKIDDWCFDQTALTGSDETATASLREAYNESEILRFTKVLRAIVSLGSGFNMQTMTNPQDFTSSQLSEILSALNHSELFHSAIPEFFNKIFTQMNVSSFLTFNVGGTNITYRTIDTQVHVQWTVTGSTWWTDTSTQANLAWWDNEIVSLTDLFGRLKEMSGGTGLDFSQIKLGGTYTDSAGNVQKITIYSFIGPLDQMNLFADCKEYIVLKFLDQNNSGTSITSYLRDINATSEYPTNSSKAYMLKRLLMPSGHTALWLNEQCGILDDFINTMTDSLGDGVSFSSGNDSTLQNLAFNLIIKTMKITWDESSSSATVVKGLLASELMANMLKEKLPLIGDLFFGASLDDQDYLYLEILEARGLQGVMKLGSITPYTTDPVKFEAELTDVFTLMGRSSPNLISEPYTTLDVVSGSKMIKVADADLAKAYNYILAKVEGDTSLLSYFVSGTTNKLNNSVVAYKLFNEYSDKYTIFSKGGTNYTIKGVIDAYNAAITSGLVSGTKIDFETKSFEDNSSSIVAAIVYLNALP